MEDVQMSPAGVAMAIDRVGVKNIVMPLSVRELAGGRQSTVARVDLSVDLPDRFKGTHMSRFIEALQAWNRELDYAGCKGLLRDVRQRLEAESAHVRFRFPYFMHKPSPATLTPSPLHYECTLDGTLEGESLVFTLCVEVPVMTVCPCSLAISAEGAHSQRTVVRLTSRFSGFVWLEELIAIAEESGSSPVYTLLKREDEKHVTEAAFANPAFVEDVVRAAAKRLADHERVSWFRVEVESYESIHNHSAWAEIEVDKSAG